MAIPKYHEFMKPILVLLGNEAQYSVTEIYSTMSDVFKLTEAEKEEWLPSKRQLIYKNRIGWALAYLKKAGLINSPKRATYQITSTGKGVLAENPVALNKRYLQRFESFQDFIEPRMLMIQNWL